MFKTIKLSNLDIKTHRILREHSNTRPNLWLVEENGINAVVKDYSKNGFFFRNTIGRFLIWREKKVYKKLKNVKNVPVLYRVIDGLALVLEEIPGATLGKFDESRKLSENFFQELRDVMKDVHAHGIAHCDLKTASNVILNCEGKPYVVDWAASISSREFRFYPFNLIYRRFIEDDLLAIIKLQLRHSPESVIPEDRRRYDYQNRLEKSVRAIRNRLRVILKRIV